MELMSFIRLKTDTESIVIDGMLASYGASLPSSSVIFCEKSRGLLSPTLYMSAPCPPKASLFKKVVPSKMLMFLKFLAYMAPPCVTALFELKLTPLMVTLTSPYT